MNAIKFKLTKLNNSNIRYEVIYKNLIRDVRKFFSLDFNEKTDFIKSKRKNTSVRMIDCLKNYILVTMSEMGEKMGIPLETLVFYLGALIYPKEMLKIYEKDNEKKA